MVACLRYHFLYLYSMNIVHGDIGIVSKIDAKNNKIRVSWEVSGGVESPWLLFISPLFYYLPKIGEQVVCFYDQFRRTGVAFGVQYVDGTAPFQDADKVGINLGTMQLVISRSTGKIEITTDDTVTITAKSVKIDADTVEITKELKVSGEATFDAAITAKSTIEATGKISSTTDVAAMGVSLSQHIHPTAGVGAPTSTPIPSGA